MDVTSSGTALSMGIAAGSASIAAYLGIFGDYIPYLIGAIALVSYMVTTGEIELKIKPILSIISSAVMIGYLSHGMTSTLSEVAYNFLVTSLPIEVIESSKSLQSGDFKNSLANTISFALAGLSRNIFIRFFSSRDKIVDQAIDKVTNKKGV